MAIVIEQSANVAAAPSTVWGLLINAAGWKSWWSDCDEALTRDFKPLREGAELELVLRPGYRRITFNPVVDLLTEGRSLSLTHRSLMFQCTVVWQISEGASGARVQIRGVFKGIQAYLLSRIGRDHLYRLILHHNLRDLRRIAEKMV